MAISDVLTKLMADNGENPHSVAAKTGLKQPTVYRIAKGETRDPRRNAVEALAKFFGLSVDEMHGISPMRNTGQGTTPQPTQQLPPDEVALLASYRALPEKERQRAIIDLDYKAKLAALDDPPSNHEAA